METKRLLIGLALGGLIASQVYAQEKNQAVSITTDTVSPTTHKFVFDNDDVITENALLDKLSLTVSYMPAILCAFAKNLRLSCGMAKSSLLKDKNKPGPCAEEWRMIFSGLGGPNSYEKQFAEFIKRWGQLKTVKSGMPELLQELHTAGYTLSMFTNMGTEDDAYFATKKFQNLYNLFKFRWCANYKPGQALIKKPSRESIESFVALDKQHNPNDTRATIFVDDKLKNCVAGNEHAGWDYIHFKNPAQLRKVLTEKGAFNIAKTE